jgi:hypothetical protein
MCFSAEVSLASFLVGLLGSIGLLFLAAPLYRLMGIFLGFVSLMQGIEFLLWKHPVCDDYHKAVSVAGMILNHLQPVVLGAATWAVYRTGGPAIAAIVGLYLLVIIPYSISYLRDDALHCTAPACGNPHLVWRWNTMQYFRLVYAVFLAAFASIGLLGIRPLNHGILFAGMAFLTYGLSAILYGRASVGALWCFWVAFLPVGLLGFEALRQALE